ncbi:hypothetical protein RyT2_04810 [Pseudolactococcus yaeyamensis]
MNNENFITSEITVSGQLGMADTKAPIEKPDLPRTSGDQPRYTVQQQSTPTGLLPTTGELQRVGGFMLGLLCLILVLMFISRSKSNISAQV